MFSFHHNFLSSPNALNIWIKDTGQCVQISEMRSPGHLSLFKLSLKDDTKKTLHVIPNTCYDVTIYVLRSKWRAIAWLHVSPWQFLFPLFLESSLPQAIQAKGRKQTLVIPSLSKHYQITFSKCLRNNPVKMSSSVLNHTMSHHITMNIVNQMFFSITNLDISNDMDIKWNPKFYILLLFSL